ncbi:MAG: hypothetical protein EA427_09265 [Spirochaetaceae bacterium]|nr:MAG: hypothetical protein EA427_09265 [Spirochaetaceae bacterium]
MQYRDALQTLADHVVLSLATAFPGHPVLGVINGRAGTAARHHALLRTAASLPRHPRVESWPEQSRSSVSTVWTDSVEALHDVMNNWIERFDGDRGSRNHTPIIASFGGDGTHNQVLRAVPAGRDGGVRDVWFFRVPLGSGNDAVGISSLPEVLGSISSRLVPVWIPEVEVQSPRRTLRAFNIASVGIDAFVTMMHHRLRVALPGNTYRIIANLALLIYERLVKLGPISVVTDQEDLGTRERVLIAFGVHGHLTYGDHIRILPTEENLCLFDRVSLWGKIRMKRLLMEGNHVHEAITTMRRAGEMRLSYEGRLPVQVDGEAEWLEAEDFPLVMRTRERSRLVLQEPAPP